MSMRTLRWFGSGALERPGVSGSLRPVLTGFVLSSSNIALARTWPDQKLASLVLLTNGNAGYSWKRRQNHHFRLA